MEISLIDGYLFKRGQNRRCLTVDSLLSRARRNPCQLKIEEEIVLTGLSTPLWATTNRNDQYMFFFQGLAQDCLAKPFVQQPVLRRSKTFKRLQYFMINNDGEEN